VSSADSGRLALTLSRALQKTDPVVVSLLVLVNGLALFNAVYHPPRVAFDANAHIWYVETVAAGRLPTMADTYEAFSPPLSYLPPAVPLALGWVDADGAAKVAQWLNVLYSIGATLLLVRLCGLIAPEDGVLPRTALLLLASMPAYYKTVAFIRPEPLLMVFSLAALLLAARLFALREPTPRGTLALGAVLGLAGLTRHQGLFLLCALIAGGLAAALGRPESRRALVKATLGTAVVASLVGGWYYPVATLGTGPFLFHQENRGLKPLSAHPEFFLGTGDGVLFSDPVRPAIQNHLVPKLYAEFWGDQECFFLVCGSARGEPFWGARLENAWAKRRAWLRTNRERMGRYLGRVNLLAVLPTVLLLGGVALGLGAFARGLSSGAAAGERILGLVVLSACAIVLGYLVFLTLFYRTSSGGMIKASYLLPAYPMVALAGAALLGRIRERSRAVHAVALAAIIVVSLHNGPAYVTHYITRAGATRCLLWP
jgi:hypothetical protein